MNRRIVFFQILRILCPSPRPHVEKLEFHYKQASDARDFLRRFIGLKCFDGVNNYLTKAFSYQPGHTKTEDALEHTHHTRAAVSFMAPDMHISENSVSESVRRSICTARDGCEQEVLLAAAALSEKLYKLESLERNLQNIRTPSPS